MDNTEQNGEELLQRIVESCKTNTESTIKTQESLEDFTALLLECEHSLRSGFALNEEIFGVQKKILKETISQIPQMITAELSKDSLKIINSFNRKSNFVWIVFGVVLLSLLTILLSGNLALKWYAESIRSKSELRQEILSEFEKDGKQLYPKNDVQQLENNTKLLRKWIEKNPKDAEKFLRFKDGYEAR
ncbi:hypothetical protein [Epilithonimonas hominis]|uniref:Uncharacterized protein n=2 Tax=Epilithonimonas hominis TaxID=420404 RepID=A0A3N0XCU8_9FLAO|nr:hypothetical protein [Epilithonimonas hominis]ROI14169.1 hypothetical protein EGH73_05370 [Epilithonimonas hominis]